MNTGQVRHFRLHWHDGEVRDIYRETITEILQDLITVGELSGLERFEEITEGEDVHL